MRFMNCTNFLAQYVDDYGRHSDFLQYCLHNMLVNTACSPIRAICWNPFSAILAIVVLYILFLIIFVPLWLISYVCTTIGSWLIFLIALHFVAVYVTQNIAFAGSSAMAQKQISGDIIGRISVFLENLALSTNEHSSILMLVATEKLPSTELPKCVYQLEQLWQSVQFIPNIHHYMNEAVDYVKEKVPLSPDETKIMSQLCSILPEFFEGFQLLLTHFSQNRHGMNPNTQRNLLSLAGKVLKSSEIMRISAVSIRPIRSEEDQIGGIAMVIKLFSSIRSSVSSFEHLSFPYMRSILQKKFLAKMHFVDVAPNCKVDCAFFPCTTQTEKRGLVFFCNPNAAFYECISQVELSKSWFGFYRNRGFDIFMFNYRGYGRSSGSPTPSAVKADAEYLLDFVRQTFNPKFVLVHGESIGGMIACHVARKKQVDALVCDRTFASLDAAACRLMGNWAGISMRWLSWWSTDVVSDYLAVTCAKILLQDPNDDIIADPASLRSGIARYFVLQEKVWSINEELLPYQRARFTNKPLSHFARSDDVVLSSIKSGLLSEEFISQFYFCCILLQKAGKSDLRSSRDERGNSSLHAKNENNSKKAIWQILSNVHGEHGHTLGSSVMRGYDGLRSWICSLCIWHDKSVFDGQTNLSQSVDALSKHIVEEADSVVDGSSTALKFVLSSLKLVASKRSEVFLPKYDHYIGKLLPVHCGHNGWLSETELKSYEVWIHGLQPAVV